VRRLRCWTPAEPPPSAMWTSSRSSVCTRSCGRGRAGKKVVEVCGEAKAWGGITGQGGETGRLAAIRVAWWGASTPETGNAGGFRATKRGGGHGLGESLHTIGRGPAKSRIRRLQAVQCQILLLPAHGSLPTIPVLVPSHRGALQESAPSPCGAAGAGGSLDKLRGRAKIPARCWYSCGCREAGPCLMARNPRNGAWIALAPARARSDEQQRSSRERLAAQRSSEQPRQQRVGIQRWKQIISRWASNPSALSAPLPLFVSACGFARRRSTHEQPSVQLDRDALAECAGGHRFEEAITSVLGQQDRPLEH